jgi:ADP-ribosyl-[dinitrogen reductase] hydrolase
VCTESCAAFAAILSHAVRHGELPEFSTIQTGDARVDAAIDGAGSPERPAMGGWVIDTLRGALWAVRHAESYEEAVWRALSLGMDADTVGAVAGVLAGGLWGCSAVPSALTAKLTTEHPAFAAEYPAYLYSFADGLLDRAARA